MTARARRILIACLLGCVGVAVLPAQSLAVPAADFTIFPSSPVSGATVTFQSVSTTTDGAPITSLTWDLNDDGVFNDASGSIAARSYRQPGTAVVALRVQDSKGQVAIAQHVVMVANRPPIADVLVFPTAPHTGQKVTFTSTSQDPDGVIAETTWDLDGDGAFDDGRGVNASTVWSTPGRHVIQLRVVDWDGGVSVAPITVQVLPTVLGRPTVAISGHIRATGTDLTRLGVTVPQGATVAVRCFGPGCPIRRLSERAATNGRRSEIRLTALERFLPVGTRVVMRVTRDGAVGRYISLAIRRNQPPLRTDSCLGPNGIRAARCPVG